MAATIRKSCLLPVIVLASVSLGAPGVRADDLPTDLSLIGNEHVGFVQVRLADLWKGEAFVPLRTLVEKAGPEMLAALDKRFVPTPSTVDRVTLILAANPQGPDPVPMSVLVVTTSRPFELPKLYKGLLPDAMESKTAADTMTHGETALRVFNDHTFAIGPTEAVTKLAAKPRGQAGQLQKAVDLAAGGQSLVAGLKLESFAPMVKQMPLPPQLLALAEARTVVISARLEKDTHLDCKLEFADARQAKQGEQGIRMAIDLALQQLQTAKTEMETLIKGQEEGQTGTAEDLPKAAAGLLGLGMIKMAEEQLGKLPIDRRGEAVTLSLDIPSGPYGSLLAWGGFSAGLMLPAVQKVRESANRLQSQNNLKQMALALLNYESAYGRFPAAAICDKKGKPLLSWRVAILPYIEQQNLYQQFHLDEPWDSKHNKTLLEQMPKIYALPAAHKPGDTKTYYRVFVGAFFDLDDTKGKRIADITDGTSNTISVVEAAEAVPWTKPEGLPYGPEKPLPKLGKFYGGGCNVAFFDGSVHFLPGTIEEATLRALITPSGGEVVQLP